MKYIRGNRLLKEGELRALIDTGKPCWVEYHHPEADRCEHGLAVVTLVTGGIYFEPFEGEPHISDMDYGWAFSGDDDKDVSDVRPNGDALAVYQAVLKSKPATRAKARVTLYVHDSGFFGSSEHQHTIGTVEPPTVNGKPTYYDDDVVPRGQRSPDGQPLNVHDALDDLWAQWHEEVPEPDSDSEFTEWLVDHGWKEGTGNIEHVFES